MIAVTRFDGSEVVVNAELIVLVEATPDTHLAMTDGRQLIVQESPDEGPQVHWQTAASSKNRCLTDQPVVGQGMSPPLMRQTEKPSALLYAHI